MLFSINSILKNESQNKDPGTSCRYSILIKSETGNREPGTGTGIREMTDHLSFRRIFPIGPLFLSTSVTATISFDNFKVIPVSINHLLILSVLTQTVFIINDSFLNNFERERDRQTDRQTERKTYCNCILKLLKIRHNVRSRDGNESLGLRCRKIQGWMTC